MDKAAARLAPLGLSPAEYTFDYWIGADRPDGTAAQAPKDNPFTYPYLASTSQDDIQIYYPSIGGSGVQFSVPDKRKGTQLFYRTRLAVPKDDMKYFQPAKTGVRIFFPRNTLKKIRNQEDIPVLYMVEGEFKSIYGDHHGLDIIGLGGINNFKEAPGSKNFHPDITYILNACRVRKLVLLADADARIIKFDPEQPEKDITKRLWSFYGAAKNIRECTQNLDLDLYFINIKDQFVESAKGLDDLLSAGIAEPKVIIDDLRKLNKCGEYFECLDVSIRPLKDILAHFFLDTEKGKVPMRLYQRFSTQLDTHLFTANKSQWKYNDEQGLHMVKHRDSFIYARIGTGYVKQIHVPNSKGELERRLEPWMKGEIIQDYVKEQGIANFMYMIPKYDAFCNVPANHPDQYRQVIENNYNLYYKVEHRPEPGEWPTIEKYLKHLFQNPYQDKYDLMLDYLKLIYEKPNQKLPIVVLASRERETGKSTFLYFLSDIFNENVAIIGNDELTDKYNDDYASKLVIGIEEGFIDKRQVLEKIKSWTTSPVVNLSTKFKSRQKISFFAHLILNTNDETDFIKIDDEETRFLMCKVPKLPAEDRDPDLQEKMKDEIPAFLHYLIKREIKHPKKTRLWFADEALETDALRKLKAFSKTQIEKELELMMKEKFIQFKETPLCLSLKDLYQEMNDGHSRKGYDRPYIQKTLEEKLNPPIPYVAKGRYEHLRLVPQYDMGQGGMVEGTREIKGYDIVRDKKQNKYYVFHAERFLKKEEIATYGIQPVEIGLEDLVATKPVKDDDLPF